MSPSDVDETPTGTTGIDATTTSSTVAFSSGLQDEISQLLNKFGVTNINTLSKQLLAGAENTPTRASDNVLLPIQMLDKELGLKRLLFMLNLTMTELIKDDRGPHGPHIVDEQDIWDHVVVLTYIFLDKMYPKIKEKYANDGLFHPKNITELVNELRGVYRMFVSNNNTSGYVKTGLSNVVATGVIGRMYIQCPGVVVEDDDEEYDEDKKKISLKEARDFLTANHPNNVAVYLSVDESMELVNNDLLLLEIVHAIAQLSPAFYWHNTLHEKRDEEITNYLMEALFASFFPGKAGFIMEMVLNLGTTSLRQIMTQPSTEINAVPIKFLRSLFLAAGEPDLATWIKLILSWQHTTQALRQTQLDTNNVEVANVIDTMIRPFHAGDPAGFLNLYEIQNLFNVESMPYEDCGQSETYAKVKDAALRISIKLDNNDNDDTEQIKSSVLDIIGTLIDLPRYDEPKMDDAYKNKCIKVVTSAINDDANSDGIIVLEEATMDQVNSNIKDQKDYVNEIRIKNYDGTDASTLTLSEDNKSSPAILSIRAPHLIRGIKSNHRQRAVNLQSNLSTMKCISDAGWVDKVVVDEQYKLGKTQLLWTESFKGNSIGFVMNNPSEKCSGSSNKGRMVALPENMSHGNPVKAKVKFLAKMVSGEAEKPIDSVVVACLVAELGLDYFAQMMEVVFGINKSIVSVDLRTNFPLWLESLETAMRGELTVEKLNLALASAEDYDSDAAAAADDDYFDSI